MTPSIVTQLPFILLVFALFATFGVLVRRGTLQGRHILIVGGCVGLIAVAAAVANAWPLYRLGMVSVPVFLVNPTIMAGVSGWAVLTAYRSQQIVDVATYTVGDTKVIVRVCQPALVPDADVLLLPTNSALQMVDGLAGQYGVAAGPSVWNEVRKHAPVKPGQLARSGAGKLAVGKIYHVAVGDVGAPVTAETLRRGMEQGAYQARKNRAESLAVAVGALRGLPIREAATASAAGVLTYYKAFAEIVVVVSSTRQGHAVKNDIAAQVSKVGGAVEPKSSNK